MIQTFLQDLRFALRQFAKRPGFTIAAVLVLALGLGANTAIFSVVNAFLLRPPPFANPDRLTALFERNVVDNNEAFNWVAPGTFLDWQKFSTAFEGMAAYNTGPMNLASPGSGFQAQPVEGCACSGNLFSTLGVPPLLGRDFRPEDDRFGAPRVTVISYGLWQRRFGGSSEIVGKHIHVDGEDSVVIGVMPRSFAFPSRNIDIWQPLLTYVSPDHQIRHDTHFLRVVARLKPGASIDRARAEIDAISARYQRAHQDEVVGRGANAVPLGESLVRNVRTSLLVLFAAVGCVLLIACINVANLLLARAAGRTREVSIRAAIGASRGRIVFQLLTESILLSLAGAAVGGALALSIAQLLASHAPGADTILISGDVPLDPVVFLFTFLIALLTGIAAGLFPAVQSARTDLVNSLKESSRSSTASRSHRHFRRFLVAAEVGLSLVLLIAAGLLLRSFSALYRVTPGVRVDHTLTMALSLPDSKYKQPARISAFVNQLSDRLKSVAGVSNAGLVSCVPVGGHCDDLVFSIVGRPLPPGQMLDALDREADPGYFAAAGIPLLRGKIFTPQDGIGPDEHHPKLSRAVISESLAKEYFQNEDPIGKQVYFEIDVIRQKTTGRPVPRFEIVGVVGDVPIQLDEKVRPTFYVPYGDIGSTDVNVVLHTKFDPAMVATAARTEINKVDPDLAIFQVRTMEEIIGESASDRKFSAVLFGSFAGLALLLAMVGLYGVLSYTASQRTSEIGIRMALGATNADVSGLMLKEGLKPAAAGVLLGLIGAGFASQLLRHLLFGVGTMDPLTFTIVPVLLLGIALLACYVPAVKATRIDPTIALRSE